MTLTRPFFTLFLVSLFLVPLVAADQTHTAPEPRVKVITRPEWISGQVAVHIFTFPSDGATLKQNTITVQIAVWGTNQDRPVYLILDGEEAARIETPGYYRYEWDLAGSHHITFRDDYTLFKTAQFNIAPPPPPIPVIPVAEFNEKLEKQFTQVVLMVSLASAIGVLSGVQLKKRTKIMSEWTLAPLSGLFLIGAIRLPELYYLVSFSLVTGLTYIVARGYAREQAILIAEKGVLDITSLTLDDDNYQIQDIGPRYWRTGFIKKRRVVLKNHKHPIDLDLHGGIFQNIKIRLVTVKGHDSIVEQDGQLVIKCAPELAQALVDSDVIERLENMVSDSNFKLLFMERALTSLLSELVLEMENIVGDMKLDRIKTVGQAQERVSEAAEQMKKVITEGLTHQDLPPMEGQ